MEVTEENELLTTPVDWSLVKTKSVEGGFELEVPNVLTGRAIAANLIKRFSPMSMRLVNKISSSEKPLTDFRFGFQASCSERTENLKGVENHFLDLVVIGDIPEEEEKLRSAFTSLLPEDYEITSD